MPTVSSLVECVAAVGAVIAFFSAYLGFLSLMAGDELEDISRAVDFGIAAAFPSGAVVGFALAYEMTDGRIFGF